MDRRQLTGMILLGLIFAAYMVYMSVNTKPAPQTAKRADSTASVAASKSAQTVPQDASPSSQASITPSTDTSSSIVMKYGALFESHLSGNEQTLTIENNLVRTTLSSKGGVLREWYLKNYKSWFGEQVQLIPYSNTKGELGLSFTTHEGKDVDTRDLYFTLASSKAPNNGIIKLGDNDSLVVTAALKLSNGATIIKTLTFYGNRYDIGVGVMMTGMENVIANRRYELSWRSGVQYQEQNSVEESKAAKALMSQNKTVEELDASDVAAPVQTNGSGTIDYAAIKTKYFTVALQPKFLNGEPAVYLDGHRTSATHEGFVEHYGMTFRLPTNNNLKADQFTAYLGPIDYDIVKNYGLERTVDLGSRWVIRPIGEFFMLPFLQLIYKAIPNYGVAIILFSLILRVMMQPLMSSQMKSSMKMQLLAPEIEKLKQKYKDDQTAQQQETMKLYGEYGINPAGGCLPLVLQFPIMIALYSLLDGAISLRQTPFIWWIHDLSVPDVLYKLPFKVPLVGVDNIVVMALLMGATMILQQKLITPTAAMPGGQQKMMMYMFPIMLTFSFSNLPSGLSLYYFVQNLIGIAYQVYLTKFSKNKMTLADLKKAPKKEGFLQKRLREAQEVAGSRGKALPEQSGQGSSSNGAKKKK